MSEPDIRCAMPSRWRFRATSVIAAVLLSGVAGVALGEWLGWPFLAAPVQRMASGLLDRGVGIGSAAEPAGTASDGFRIRFVGGIRLFAPQLVIAAPAWSSAPYLMRAGEVALDLRYLDLWRAHRGQALRVDRLRAATLDAHLERLADGRVSWQFGPLAAALPAQPIPVPSFGSLQVAAGTLHIHDAPLALDAEARLSLSDAALATLAPEAPASGAAGAIGSLTSVLQVAASGHFHHLPLKAELVSAGVMPWAADEVQAVPVPLTLQATVGRASLVFKGSAVDALSLRGLSGRFSLKGPSLAAVGDPVGVTLPTTSAFHGEGVVVKQGDTWYVRLDDATVGASHLNGAFTYGCPQGRGAPSRPPAGVKETWGGPAFPCEAGRSVPLLSGRLGGSRLLLADMGPVVGTTPAVAAAAAAMASSAGSEPPPLAASTRGRGRVLPNRPFDLATMRAMDANVAIDVREVDLNTGLLEPFRPLRGHLQLAGGVLTLSDLDTRTGDGHLSGDLRLDGRGSTALWNADLRWDGIRLERWIVQKRANGLPPYVSGRLSGRVTLQGQGGSTAEILASLKGHARTDLRDGAVSHVAIEAAGLDLAQGLGVLLKGDDALPVQCGLADLVADGGVFRPRVMVLDTKDSTVWIDGSLSLATEQLDLRTVVMPKDFSPLALRTPLRVRGSLAHPEVSLEPGPLSLKVAAAIALAFVNPLAALIPFIDPGDADAARRGAVGCLGLKQRGTAKLAVSDPAR